MDAHTVTSSDTVSCQVLGQIFIACDEKGVSTDAVLQGVPYSREHIETPSNFIDWQSLNRLLEQAAANFSDEEIYAVAEHSYRQPLFRIYRLIGQLRFDLRGFYHYLFGQDSVVSRFYPIKSEVLIDDPVTRQLRFRFEMRNNLKPSQVFFKILEGQARGVSSAMGYAAADVEARCDAGSMELTVWLPRERGFVAGLRQLITSPLTWFRTAQALQETQDALVEKNRQLTIDKRQLELSQQRIAEQQQQLNLLAQHTPILLWSVDLQFRTLYCSPSVERLLGYSLEEAMAFSPFQMLDEESQQRAAEIFSESFQVEESGTALKSGRSLRLRHLRKDGTTFWSDNYLSFTRDAEGRPIGIVGVSVDIDDRVRYQQRESELEEQLHLSRRQEMVGKLAGGIAHDFNNALQSIIGFSELAELSLDAQSKMPISQSQLDDVRHYQELILRSASSASELVRQLLAYSRQQSLNMKPLALKSWLSELRPMLESMLGARIALKLELADNFSILADRIELERVIINLTLNARDAMVDGGELTISLGPASSEALPASKQHLTSGYLSLKVIDNGEGIDAESIERIFDPYFSTKAPELGSGLGLAVSAGIIEQHNGHIHARNNHLANNQHKGQPAGATIEVVLPMIDASEASLSAGVSPTQSSLKDCRVLAVDDQHLVVDLVESILSREGARITTAETGDQAVLQFAAEPFDLVIMDVITPGMGSGPAVQKIRRQNPSIPLLFITGYAGDNEVLQSFDNEQVLKKPFSREKLLHAIHTALHQQSTETEN